MFRGTRLPDLGLRRCGREGGQPLRFPGVKKVNENQDSKCFVEWFSTSYVYSRIYLVALVSARLKASPSTAQGKAGSGRLRPSPRRPG
jgi:hypothetical protein